MDSFYQILILMITKFVTTNLLWLAKQRLSKLPQSFLSSQEFENNPNDSPNDPNDSNPPPEV